MPTPITAIVPVTAATPVADAATPELVLQAGSVVDARVISVIADNLVRIAIANLSIDVASEVDLSPGQHLQLAVSQNEAGIRLAIVEPGSRGLGDPVTLTLGGAAIVDSPALAPSPAAAQVASRSPLEQIAVSLAATDAAVRQGSQAPLFADLVSVISNSDLPAGLKQAVADVLAQQTPLTPEIDGGDIAGAFQKSGLLLEAKLASGTAPSAEAAPDLKAALLVLRQALRATSAETDTASARPQPAIVASRPATLSANQAESISGKVIVSPSEPQLVPTPQALPARPDAPAFAVVVASLPDVIVPRAIAAGSSGPLQEAAQIVENRAATLPLIKSVLPETHALAAAASRGPAPPPFRGALPSAQPIAVASLPSGAPLGEAVHRLINDTEAAIARQTLLQIASLPERSDMGPQWMDASSPQWNFEIPFATPQGTAMAQFEISRDGGGSEIDEARKSWRARFSLNVEPAGPVHALITLSGDKTYVRMWAERSTTAQQLRAGAGELSAALVRAELVPGDIVIREGAPPQPAPARAGHFLDRAT